MSAHSTTLVVIPTYNEAESIDHRARRVCARRPDGGHPGRRRQQPRRDGALAVGRPRRTASAVHLLNRDRKDGLGAAYRAGFGWALAGPTTRSSRWTPTCRTRRSGSPRWSAALEHADVAIGSRYVPRRRDPRLAAGAPGDLARRQHLRPRWSSGCRCTTRPQASRRSGGTRWSRSGRCDSESNGYCFQIENTWRASRLGLRITEVPITFTDRDAGRVEDDRRHRPRGDAAGAGLALARARARPVASGRVERPAEAGAIMRLPDRGDEAQLPRELVDLPRRRGSRATSWT